MQLNKNHIFIRVYLYIDISVNILNKYNIFQVVLDNNSFSNAFD